MRLHRFLLAVLGLLAVGGLATSAFASRAATDDEKAAVVAAARVSMDPSCVTVRISSVDERYAQLYSAGNSSCPDADGSEVLHLVDGRWRIVYESSGDVSCPSEMPQAVAIDFKLCSAPSRRVYVAREGRLVYKPRWLLQGAHGAYERLRWTRWGTAAAVGRGTLHYEDRYTELHLRVRLTLTARRLCGNKRTYQHLRVRVLSGSAQDRKGFGGTANALGCTYDT